MYSYVSVVVFLFVRFDLFVFVSQEVSDLHRHIFVWEIIFLISFFPSIPEWVQKNKTTAHSTPAPSFHFSPQDTTSLKPHFSLPFPRTTVMQDDMRRLVKAIFSSVMVHRIVDNVKEVGTEEWDLFMES